MIDADVLDDLRAGTRWDRSMAILLGLVAVVAAMLVLCQTVQGQREARANALAARLTATVSTGLLLEDAVTGFRIANLERATQVGMAGGSRQIEALLATGAAGGPTEIELAVDDAVGAAELAASSRLMAIIEATAQLPADGGRLDPYARLAIARTVDDLAAMVATQRDERARAETASGHSNEAVLGLSIVALAGVLAGLAAVLGRGRAGWALIASGYGALAVSVAILVVAAELLPA